MFIAIVGTRCSGKSSVEEYFISVKHFTPVRIIHSELGDESESVEVPSRVLSSSSADINSALNSKLLIGLDSHRGSTEITDFDK